MARRQATLAVADAVEVVSANTVGIVGHLAAGPSWRELTDGSRLEFRISVPRARGGKDVIECFVPSGKLAARLEAVPVGRAISVQGELRSRYWSSGGRVVSRLQVEVTGLRVLPK